MNNEMLAEVWQDNIQQLVIVWPLAWKHYPRGNWFIYWDISKTYEQNLEDNAK